MYFFPVILLYKHHCTMQNQLFPQRMLKSADLVFSLQLNEMIRNPGEGHFWQVDHIKPVFSGGGQCSLDNLQTLCTVCHKEVSELSDTCDCPGYQIANYAYRCEDSAGECISLVWDPKCVLFLSSPNT